MEDNKKLLMKRVKPFEGSYLSFQQFIDNIENVVEGIEKPEEISEILQFTLRHLVSPTIYIKLKLAKTNNFQDFKKSIEEILFGFETAQKFRNKINSTKMSKNQTLQEFIEGFRVDLNNLKSKLSNEVANTDYFKEDIKRLFLNNLLPQYRMLAITYKNDNIEKIMKELVESADIDLGLGIEEKRDKILVLTSNPKKNGNINYNSKNRQQNPFFRNFHLSRPRIPYRNNRGNYNNYGNNNNQNSYNRYNNNQRYRSNFSSSYLNQLRNNYNNFAPHSPHKNNNNKILHPEIFQILNPSNKIFPCSNIGVVHLLRSLFRGEGGGLRFCNRSNKEKNFSCKICNKGGGGGV